MLGIGGAGARGGPAQSEPKSPDQVPGCLAWFDGSQGVVATAGEVDSWTDRINGFILTPPDPDKPLTDGARVYVDGVQQPPGSLTGSATQPDGTFTDHVVDIGTANPVDFSIELFNSEVEIYDGQSGNIIGTDIPSAGASLQDVLVNGVSIINEPGTTIDEYGSNITVLNFDYTTGNVQILLRSNGQRRLSLRSAQGTIIASIASAGDPDQAIFATSGGGTLNDVLEISDGEIQLRDGTFSTTHSLGTAGSRVFAVAWQSRALEMDPVVSVQDFVRVAHIGSGETGRAYTTGSQSRNPFSPPDPADEIQVFPNGYSFPDKISIYDLAIFDRVLSHAEIESVLRALAAKRDNA